MAMGGDEAAFARILSRVDRAALARQCAGAFAAELRDARRSLWQAREAVQALRELDSAARYLRGQRRVTGGASTTSGAVVSACEQVVALGTRLSGTLDRAVGGVKDVGMHAEEEVEASADGIQRRGDCRGAGDEDAEPVVVTTPSKKRKLSSDTLDVASNYAPSAKRDRNPNGPIRACTPDPAVHGDAKPVVASASPQRHTLSADASSTAGFDPNESPIDLPVPESDESDSETNHTVSRSSCLESARQLLRGTAANQTSRFPTLVQQLHSYLHLHRQDFAAPDKAQEFVEAVDLAIRIGMQLQFLPAVRDALASLLIAVEQLEQAVDPLPSPLNENVEKLSLYFLGLASPQASDSAVPGER